MPKQHTVRSILEANAKKGKPRKVNTTPKPFTKTVTEADKNANCHAEGKIFVSGYTRKDGKVVSSHCREQRKARKTVEKAPTQSDINKDAPWLTTKKPRHVSPLIPPKKKRTKMVL